MKQLYSQLVSISWSPTLNLQRISYFEYNKVFAPKSLARNTMMTQYHYKRYELNLQKIVKYALDYNGICLFWKLYSLFLETYHKQICRFQ